MDQDKWCTRMIIALVLQIASGVSGIILSFSIQKKIILVIQHILLIIFALIGIAGYKNKLRYCILTHGFCTIALSFGFTAYELIVKSILGQLNLEILLLLPFFIDFLIGIPSFIYYTQSDKPEHEYSEIPATTYQGYLTQNLLGINTCCICSDNPADFAVVPCGQKCLCRECMKRFTKGKSLCPICRKTINDLVKIYE